MAVAEQARTKVLRFGIAGLGVASNQILAGFPGRAHLQVTAAADIRPDALRKFAREYEAETYGSVAEMCKSPNVDAIYVCSPNHLHCEHVISAADNGKHAIVEKPMGLTLDECEAMNQAAERNGVRLLCGHTHSFDPPIRKMREIVKSGELGKLAMVHSWNFNEFMYRPRMPHELDPNLGGNVVFNQGPHQVDVVRLIGGGLVHSVRGMTGIWDPARRVEGAWCAYLEFEDGTPATLVYNGYGHFDTAEFFWWIGEGGQPRAPETNLRTRAALQATDDEVAWKETWRYGANAGPSPLQRGGEPALGQAPHPEPVEGRAGRMAATTSRREQHQPFFGLTIVSCEHGDIRQSTDGLYIYGDDRKWEVPVEGGLRGRAAELEELYSAVIEGRPVFHDGRWGEATLEVVLGIMESARTRQEVRMSRQVPSPE